MGEVVLMMFMVIGTTVIAVFGVSAVNTKNAKPKPLDKLNVKEISEEVDTITKQVNTLKEDMKRPIKAVGDDISSIEKKVNQLYDNDSLAVGQAKSLSEVKIQLKELRAYSPKLKKKKDKTAKKKGASR